MRDIATIGQPWVSGKDAPLNFLTSRYQVQNDLKAAIIYLDWPDIG